VGGWFRRFSGDFVSLGRLPALRSHRVARESSSRPRTRLSRGNSAPLRSSSLQLWRLGDSTATFFMGRCPAAKGRPTRQRTGPGFCRPSHAPRRPRLLGPDALAVSGPWRDDRRLQPYPADPGFWPGPGVGRFLSVPRTCNERLRSLGAAHATTIPSRHYVGGPRNRRPRARDVGGYGAPRPTRLTSRGRLRPSTTRPRRSSHPFSKCRHQPRPIRRPPPPSAPPRSRR
jgi:hypothetical protein